MVPEDVSNVTKPIDPTEGLKGPCLRPLMSEHRGYKADRPDGGIERPWSRQEQREAMGYKADRPDGGIESLATQTTARGGDLLQSRSTRRRD